MPIFVPAQKVEQAADCQKVEGDLQKFYRQTANELEVNYNHFVSVQERTDFEVEIEHKTMVVDSTEGRTIEPCIINGYDGFGGAHNNMLWNWQNNFLVYTLNNKVIIEDMKTRR